MPRPDYESNDLAGAAHYAAQDAYDDRPSPFDLRRERDDSPPVTDWASLASRADSGALR